MVEVTVVLVTLVHVAVEDVAVVDVAVVDVAVDDVGGGTNFSGFSDTAMTPKELVTLLLSTCTRDLTRLSWKEME